MLRNPTFAATSLGGARTGPKDGYTYEAKRHNVELLNPGNVFTLSPL